MTARELVEKLEDLGFVGENLEVAYMDYETTEEVIVISEVVIEERTLRVRRKDWDPIRQPEVYLEITKRYVILK